MIAYPFRYQTIIHGEPRASNFFFKADDSGTFDVGLIGMRWCGPGLGAVDVAYCMAVSADESVFGKCSGDHNVEAAVMEYLDYYYSCLLEGFVAAGIADDLRGAYQTLPREIFQDQFEWAWIDLTRAAIGARWDKVKRRFFEERAGKISHDVQKKSLITMYLLVELAHTFLLRRE